MVLIRTCPKSGTQYCARWFRALGYNFAHEDLKKDGGVGWNMSFKGPGPPRCLDNYKLQYKDFKHILHQVRNPLHTIQSLGGMDHLTINNVQKIIGPLPKPRILRGAQFWLKWNQMCSNPAQFTYKVEDLKPNTETTHKIAKLMNFDPNQVKQMPKRLGGKHETRIITLNDITDTTLKNQIAELATQYGYKI